MQAKRIVIIGGSAAGFYAAQTLARAGLPVTVYEASDELDPAPRTLIVTDKFREQMGELAAGAIVNEIRTFELFANGDRAPALRWAVPVLVLIVPVFDAALVSVSRVRRGLSPFSSPGKDHTAHRLAARLGQRRAVVALYAVGAVGGALAVALLQVGPKAATFLVLVAAVLGAAALVLLERGFATD